MNGKEQDRYLYSHFDTLKSNEKTLGLKPEGLLCGDSRANEDSFCEKAGNDANTNSEEKGVLVDEPKQNRKEAAVHQGDEHERAGTEAEHEQYRWNRSEHNARQEPDRQTQDQAFSTLKTHVERQENRESHRQHQEDENVH